MNSAEENEKQQLQQELVETSEEEEKEEESGGLDSAGDEEKTDEADIESLKNQLAEKTAMSEEYFQRMARLQADFENYRRRTAREKEDLVRFATEQLITSLLPVMDNFERALASSRENLDRLLEGVEMIHRQMSDLLAVEGLTPIPAVGELFDPGRHEAVLRIEDDEHDENIILEELRKGYYLKDKVIRPSMVKIAKPVAVSESE